MNQMIQQFGRFFAVVGAMAVLWPVAAFECATGMARVEKFDTAELGENRRPPGWSFYQKPDGNGTVSVVCEGEGRAVRIDSSGLRGRNAVGISRRFGARPGQPYRITVRLKSAGTAPAKAGFNAVFSTESGKWTNAARSTPEGIPADRFAEYSLDVKAPVDVKELAVELYVPWNTPGSVLLERISVDPLTPDGLPSTVFGKAEIGARELYLDTPLIRSGRPSAAIVIGDERFRPLAEQVNAAIRAKCGAELPVKSDREFAEVRRLPSPLILIGNCDDNLAVRNFYLRHYVILDAKYPGAGGYNVRTLHNPFADGHNVIFAGGSDFEGHEAAVEKLAERIAALPESRETLTLPRLAEIRYPAADGIRLGWGCEWDGFFGYCPISRAMAAYYMTGDRKYIGEMRRTAFPADAEAVRRNNRSGRYDDGADPIATPYHYWGMRMALYWDMIEEDPVFSPEERLRITRKLYEQLQYWICCGYGGNKWYMVCVNALPHTRLADRHYLMEALCAYTVARYFDKYYPGVDSRETLRCVRNVFAPLWDSVTPNLSWRAWAPSMLYPALQYGIWEEFPRAAHNPDFRASCELMLMMSSLKPGEWMNGFPGLYGALAQLFGDGGYARMQQLLLPDPGAVKIGQAFFRPGEQFRQDYFARTAGKFVRSQLTSGKMECPHLPADLPADEVDAVHAYRQRPDGSGDYLRLDTRYRLGSRTGFFNFSIDELLLGGGRVLLGGSQLFPLPDGISAGKEAWYARVRESGKLGDTAFFRAAVPEYNDCDWERTLLLRDGRFLLAVDTLLPRRDNLLYLENCWRPAPYNGNRLTAAGDFVTADSAEPPPSGEGVYARLTAAELYRLEQPGRKGYELFRNTATFSGFTAEEPLAIPFVLPEAKEAVLKLWCFGQPGSELPVTFRLDGRTIRENAAADPSGKGRFHELELGKFRLAAGQHRLEILPSCPGEAPIRSFSGFAALSPERAGESMEFTLSCAMPSEPQIVPVRLNGPDGGDSVESCKLVFRFLLPVRRNRPLRLATLVRRGTLPEPAAACSGERVALRLPEPALLEFRDGGFLLTEAGRLSGSGIREVPGLFRYPQPVAFCYRAADGMLEVLGPDGESRRRVPGFRLPAAEELKQESERIFASAVKYAPKPEANAPEVPPELLENFDAPVGSLCEVQSSEGTGFAAAAGRKLAIYGASGGTPVRLETAGRIGALHFWKKTGLLAVADDLEHIAVFRPDGKKEWELLSELAKGDPGLSSFWSKKNYPGVYALADAELVPGKTRLYAGSTGTLEVIDPAGKRCDSFWQDYGPVDSLALLPAEDGHGAELFSARTMGAWPTTWGVRNSEGRLVSSKRWMIEDRRGDRMTVFGFSGVGKTHLKSVRLKADEPARLLGVFSGAQNRAALWDFTGKVLAGIDLGSGEIAAAPDYAARALTQRSIRGLEAADLDGDGEKELILAHARGILYLFDRNFQLKKLVRLPGEPFILAALPGRRAQLAVGITGAVLLLDGSGVFTGRVPVEGRPTALLQSGGTLLIGTDAGKLYRSRLR